MSSPLRREIRLSSIFSVTTASPAFAITIVVVASAGGGAADMKSANSMCTMLPMLLHCFAVPCPLSLFPFYFSSTFTSPMNG